MSDQSHSGHGDDTNYVYHFSIDLETLKSDFNVSAVGKNYYEQRFCRNIGYDNLDARLCKGYKTNP